MQLKGYMLCLSVFITCIHFSSGILSQVHGGRPPGFLKLPEVQNYLFNIWYMIR